MTQITSAAKEFFLVALPGLEDLVQAEVADWFPHFVSKVEHGGVTVMAPLGEGLAMNLVLKTPTRILLRVTSFVARDFPKLFKKISTFPWREWLRADCELTVHATTTKSRLKIKKRIEETCREGWSAWQKQVQAGKTPGTPKGETPATVAKVTLFVRLNDNQCTLSLDTSGERLHKRGSRALIGAAPLRETIAAALLQMIARSYQTPPKYPVEVVDPMMGSGTFLIEAGIRDRQIEAREFGFGGFAEVPAPAPRARAQSLQLASLVGFEADKKTFNAAEENLRALQLDTSLSLYAQDFFTATALPEERKVRWVLANPPYGARLKVKVPLAQYYAKLFAAAEATVKPERACFLLPANVGRLDLPATWKVLAKRRLSNGGIPVIAFLFGRNEGPVEK